MFLRNVKPNQLFTYVEKKGGNSSIYLPEIAEVVKTQQLTAMEKYIELKLKKPDDIDIGAVPIPKIEI